MDFLIVLLLLPLGGALFILLWPNASPRLIRLLALSTASLALLLSVVLSSAIDFNNPAVQLFSKYTWNPRLGTYFVFGVDGISYPLIVLTQLLILIALSVSGSIKERIKSYYVLVLLLEFATTGVFISQGWALFYVFWELVLIPLFFLIDRWGESQRQTAALNFVLYTMGGSVFMLLSLLLLFDANPAHSFLFDSIKTAAQALPASEQTLIFLGLLIGFGVKMPIFPLHGWLPLADVEAPTPVAMLLSGILVKMGAYGLIRSVDMLPQAALQLQGLLVALGLIGIIYGGLLAWRQQNLKRMVAYASVSHMGAVLVGIATLNHYGLTGALTQMLGHGLVSALLFMLVGLLYERTQTYNIDDYGSMLATTPLLAGLMVFALLGNVGMPGTIGFVAELHTLVGGFQRWTWLIAILSLGVLISATYSVRTAKRLYTGPMRGDWSTMKDLNLSECMAGMALMAATLWLGFYPTLLISRLQVSVSQWASAFVQGGL
ncbi:complex I subunit 4 family protein [Thiolinea disciformis]|uniref:complex I subunit 4 family protein n=1 Tax=Thiolinea disciformis TaxID=125614 RepID=UPI00035EF873|nr:NADH-quinone oxidoreductase subunit M [Thiolinea disciformis]